MSFSSSELPSDSRKSGEPHPQAGNRPAAGLQSSGLTARQRSRRRKAIYLVAIIALIVSLFALSFPSTVGTTQTKGHPGGVLAQYRDSHGLSQTELGTIDPMSQTVYMATMGMRGVGMCVLWWNAQKYQMKKDWTELRATLDQIAKFQPHSINVWKHQAWNLSYNVSVAFDDYHDKFYWVIEGLNYMLDGIKLNPNEPRLYWDMAWFISNKIGRADEAKYYRRLFSGKKDVSEKSAEFRSTARRDDSGGDYAPDYVKDFRERYPTVLPIGIPRDFDVRDNWHLGKLWFLAAESKIDTTPMWPGGPPRHPVRGMADVIFYSDAPTCQFYYAESMEKDGTFGDAAKNAWKVASTEWHDFGDQWIDTSYGIKLRLNDKEPIDAQIIVDKAALDKLAPGERANLYKEKLARLTPEEREAWEMPVEKRNQAQQTLVFTVQNQERMDVKDFEVANRVYGPKSKEASKLAKEIVENQTLSTYINRQRMTVNFEFWRTRALAEQSEDGVAARKAVYDGDEAFAKGDQIRAKPFYVSAMQLWRKVLDRYPLLIDDVNLGSDLVDVIHRYQKCLDQDDQDLPQPFILQDILTKWANRAGSGQ